jgi:hypothetical protein
VKSKKEEEQHLLGDLLETSLCHGLVNAKLICYTWHFKNLVKARARFLGVRLKNYSALLIRLRGRENRGMSIHSTRRAG